MRRGPRNPTIASPNSKSEKDPGSATSAAPRSSFLPRPSHPRPSLPTDQPFQSGNTEEPRSKFQSITPSRRNLSSSNEDKKMFSARKDLESRTLEFLSPSNLSPSRMPEDSFPTPGCRIPSAGKGNAA